MNKKKTEKLIEVTKRKLEFYVTIPKRFSDDEVVETKIILKLFRGEYFYMPRWRLFRRFTSGELRGIADKIDKLNDAQSGGDE